MLWVTRSHVHVDRVACPWLIKRFVDSDAEFLFVAKSQIELAVKETGAIPFDAPDVELGHHDGKCTFEAILEQYELTDPALRRMARIVHGADTGHMEGEAVAPGLEALATGFGLLFPDDEKNLAYQFTMYDALYGWCRLQAAKEGK